MSNAQTLGLGGPMFESATSDFWTSIHGKEGGHYNTFSLSRGADGMAALRDFFPDGKCDEMNLIFFSTSGVHGSYCTIEEVEASQAEDADQEERIDDVTFLIVQPRIVATRHGNVEPQTPDDFAFLKRLRASGLEAASTIGLPDAE